MRGYSKCWQDAGKPFVSSFVRVSSRSYKPAVHLA